MNSLQDIVDEIQGVVRDLENADGDVRIRKAPDNIPEDLAQYPFAVCFPREGYWTMTPSGMIQGMHTFWLEVHVARKDMPRDSRKVISLSKVIPEAIWSAYKDQSLTHLTVMSQISYTFGVLDWLGTETMGFRFMIEGVKTQEVFS